MLYHFSYYTEKEHKDEYHHISSDADAMMAARKTMRIENAETIYIYRHKDENTCGIKEFVVCYQNKEEKQ